MTTLTSYNRSDYNFCEISSIDDKIHLFEGKFKFIKEDDTYTTYTIDGAIQLTTVSEKTKEIALSYWKNNKDQEYKFFQYAVVSAPLPIFCFGLFPLSFLASRSITVCLIVSSIPLAMTVASCALFAFFLYKMLTFPGTRKMQIKKWKKNPLLDITTARKNVNEKNLAKPNFNDPNIRKFFTESEIAHIS